MSGSGGDLGYDYQANALAYIAAHGLCDQPLAWFDGFADIPASWLAETGGPGDDVRIVTVGRHALELQAKHAVRRGPEFYEALIRLFNGLLKDPGLRAVLLTDSAASQTVRLSVRGDFVRLGQGRCDGLSGSTVEVLKQLEQCGPLSADVFSRFQIVVVDLDIGTGGAATAQALLSRVVESKDSVTAYQLLGKRGHHLIKARGQDDVAKCARFLKEAVGLVAAPPSFAAAATQFCDWSLRVSSTFYSPALQHWFPIFQAWNRVEPIGESDGPASSWGAKLDVEIKRYQEWTRLADRSTRDSAISGDAFVDKHRWSVILAGPGAGKSTLARKLAFLNLSHGKLAVRLRLPTVAKILADGSTFDSALVEAAMDSSGLGYAEGKRFLDSADLLIGDGLDECDPHRARIANDLSMWAASHPRTHICVLTRPVGHSSALLPGFSHAELLPLPSEEVHQVATNLVRAKIEDKAKADAFLRDFKEAVKQQGRRGAAFTAKHNPLLLSFLVRLYLEGEPITGKRVAIFERTVELMRNSPLIDRNSLGVEPDPVTARTVCEVAAWSCIEKPDRSISDIYRMIADDLGGGLEAVRSVQFAINFWVERGLMERLTSGSRDALVFMHSILGEYLAGCHLSRLDRAQLESQIEKYRRVVRWREPMLLAAGAGAGETIVRTLIRLDSPDDPESTEAILAAAALGEMNATELPPILIQELLDTLARRLGSSVPCMAIEAAVGLLQVVPVSPDLMAQIAVQFCDHEQDWTRFAARCLGMASDSELITINCIVHWLEEFRSWVNEKPRVSFVRFGEGSYELLRASIPKGLKRVVREFPPDEARVIVRSFENSSIPVGVWFVIQNELHQAEFFWRNDEEIFASFQKNEEYLRREDETERLLLHGKIVLFESILKACASEENADTASSFEVIGVLLGSMGFWDLELGDLNRIWSEESKALLVEIIGAMILALALDTRKLSSEAAALLSGVRSSQAIYSLIPDTRREPQWDRLRRAKFDIDVFAKGLRESSWFIASNAAELFGATSRDRPASGELLKKILFEGSGSALFLVSNIAESVWGEDAFETLRARLQQNVIEGCGYLFGPIVRLARGPQELGLAIETSLAGIDNMDSQIAEAAAKALVGCHVDAIRPYQQRLQSLLEIWKVRLPLCPDCRKPVENGGCAICKRVPPEPRKHIIAVLGRLRALSTDELLSLEKETRFGIGDAARESIAQLAYENADVMSAVVAYIHSGHGSVGLLDALLKRPPETLKSHSEDLATLMSSRVPFVRARILLALGTGWMSPDCIREEAKRGLSDDAPEVRSAAVKVLREQSQLA